MAISIIPDKILFQQGVRVTPRIVVIDTDKVRGTPSSATGQCNMFLIAARSWTTQYASGSLYLCSGVDGGLWECVQIVRETYGPSMTIVWDSNNYPNGRIQITFNDANGGVYAILPVM